MGKIGDLVNRIISPLLNRSTDSQTVADPRRGRIGYVGNITLISQLINDVGYTTSEGKVTNVDISAGKFVGWEDIAPADDELIPKFNVPTSTSDLDNDVHYGTGTITELTAKGASVSTSDNIATVTVNWKNGENYYENDRGYTKNKGNVVKLIAEAGEPSGVGINPETGEYTIKLPTLTSHLVNNTYITTNYSEFADINTTKSIAITNNNKIFSPADNSPLNQEQLNNFKLYKCGNMYTFFGQYDQTGIHNNPVYVPLFLSKLEPDFSANEKIVIGNGIVKWTNANGYARATPVVITCMDSNYDVEIGMYICSLSTSDSSSDSGFSNTTPYTIYISGTIFSNIFE